MRLFIGRIGMKKAIGVAAFALATSAALTAQATTLNAPLYDQLESNWCWIATAEMAMWTVWNGLSNGDVVNGPTGAQEVECSAAIIRQQKGGGWGTGGQVVNCCATETWSDTSGCNHTGSARSVLTDNGFTYTTTSQPGQLVLPFSTLQSEISAGRPVPFNLNWNAGGNHWMIVVGTSVDSSGQDWVNVNDPGNLDQELYTYKVWSNQNNKVDTFVINEEVTNVKSSGPPPCAPAKGTCPPLLQGCPGGCPSGYICEIPVTGPAFCVTNHRCPVNEKYCNGQCIAQDGFCP
jgi:hypothetical protein